MRCGGALLAASLTLIALAPILGNASVSLGALFLGWTVAGAGMGLCYLEILSRIFDQPPVDDGISAPQAAAAAVLVEIIATALATTATASALSIGTAAAMVAAVYSALAVIAALLVALLFRTLSSARR